MYPMIWDPARTFWVFGLMVPVCSGGWVLSQPTGREPITLVCDSRKCVFALIIHATENTVLY